MCLSLIIRAKKEFQDLHSLQSLKLRGMPMGILLFFFVSYIGVELSKSLNDSDQVKNEQKKLYILIRRQGVGCFKGTFCV